MYYLDLVLDLDLDLDLDLLPPPSSTSRILRPSSSSPSSLSKAYSMSLLDVELNFPIFELFCQPATKLYNALPHSGLVGVGVGDLTSLQYNCQGKLQIMGYHFPSHTQ